MQEIAVTKALMVGALFAVRCITPMLVMFGLSSLLRRLGLISKPPTPPTDWNNPFPPNQPGEGKMAHA